MNWYAIPRKNHTARIFASKKEARVYADRVIPCVIGEIDPARFGDDVGYWRKNVIGMCAMRGTANRRKMLTELGLA